jgi:hypothetical protein
MKSWKEAKSDPQFIAGRNKAVVALSDAFEKVLKNTAFVESHENFVQARLTPKQAQDLARFIERAKQNQ